MDKLSIKVCKPNECLYVLYTCGGILLLDGANFLGIHTNPIVGNDES